MTLGEGDARFDANAYAKRGGNPSIWIYAGGHGVFDPTPLRRPLAWSLDSTDFDFKLPTETLLKRGVIALCPKPVSAEAIAQGCTLFSLKGFSAAFDYACDAREIH